MEDLHNRFRMRGTNLDTDASEEVRGKKIGSRAAKSTGKDFEDFGSDFCKSARELGFKSQGVVAKFPLNTIEDDSDDELDLLNYRKPKGTEDTKYVNGIVMNGNYHRYHENFPPRSTKFPRFKKLGRTNREVGDDTQSSQSSTCSTRAAADRPDSQPTSLHPSKSSTHSATKSIRQPVYPGSHIDVVKTTTPSSPKRQRASFSLPAPKSPYGGARSGVVKTVSAHIPAGGRKSTHRGQAKSPSPEPAKESHTPRASKTSRLKPRPVYKDRVASPASAGREQNDGLRGNAQKGRHAFPKLSPLMGGKDLDAGSSCKGKEKRDVDPIGALSPLSSQTLEPRAQANSPERARALQDFPEIPPLSLSKEYRAFEAKVCQTSKAGKDRGRKVVVHESATDKHGNAPRPTPIRSFPMDLEPLENRRHSPGKRASEGGSDVPLGLEAPRKRKKRANADEILAELLSELSDSDDEILLHDPSVDPRTLCPWCDERLPPAPTPHLSSLIAAAREVSSPDSRPTNPLGLCAPLGSFIGVCQRHRFESYQVPRAQRSGWPMHIDWNRVGARVDALMPQLQGIINDVDEDFLLGSSRKDAEDGHEGEDSQIWVDRPRKNSVFWRDIVKSVRKKGSRQTAGIAGQFANFSKTQPGYYGELGYMIIHQTIYNLFPLSSFDASSTLPLTPADFVQHILVPEAAVFLIMEDMGQTRQQAIVTLRESAEYGVAMFPDDHADDMDAMDAAEQIVMERARARRKELEEEERNEEEELQRVQEQEITRRGVIKGKHRAGIGSAGPASEISDAELEVRRLNRTKEKRGLKARTRRGNTMCLSSDLDSESDSIMLSDIGASTFGRAKEMRRDLSMTPSRPKSRRLAAVSTIAKDHRADSSDTGSPPTRPRPRPRMIRQHFSQGKVIEKENAHLDDGSDSDVQMLGIGLPLSQSKSHCEVKSDRDENAYFNERPVEADTTPRPKRFVQVSGCVTGVVADGGVCPLIIAHNRFAQKVTGGNPKMLPSSPHNSTTESAYSDGELPVSSLPSSSNPEPRHPIGNKQVSQQPDTYDWLLDS